LFWEKGYHSTSLADLMKATGVQKGSFYNAFGNKKKLFTMSVLKYEREQRKEILAELELLGDPLQAIETFFDSLIEQSITDEKKKGCFLINLALDMPNQDEDIQIIVKKGLGETEAFFERQIALGLEMGVIPQTVDAKREASGLMTLLVGLRVLSRGTYSTDALYTIKNQALRLLQ
jgi:TetR/AcrR family transcriptional repressor of nem operon